MKFLFQIVFCFALYAAAAQTNFTLEEYNIRSTGLLKGTKTLQGLYSSLCGYTNNKKDYAVFTLDNKVYFSDVSTEGAYELIDSLQLPYMINSVFILKNLCLVSNSLFTDVFDLSNLPDTIKYLGEWQGPKLASPIITGNKLFNFRYQIKVYDITNPLLPVLLDSSKSSLPHIPGLQSPQVFNDTIYGYLSSKAYYKILYDQTNHIFSILDSVPVFLNGVSIFSACGTENGTIFQQYSPATLKTSVHTCKGGKFIKHQDLYFSKAAQELASLYIGDNWLAVYNSADGLSLHDISDLNSIRKTGAFSSRSTNLSLQLQGGIDKCVLLNEHKMLALDQRKGIFVLDISQAKKRTTKKTDFYYELNLFPIPCDKQVNIHVKRDYPSVLEIYDSSGKKIFNKDYSGDILDVISVSTFKENEYILKIYGNEGQLTRKLIIQH